MLGNGFCLGVYADVTLTALALADIAHRNSTLWIWEFHVAEAWRGPQISSRMINELAQRARNANLRTMIVETQNTNVPAIRFYQRCGFTLEGFDLSYYSNND
jgi:ribosomal protein S18 acetylase RimI-like enzyme